jgi:TRAP-type C4-dicarboxylate transport system substrate-binding protein
MSIIYQQAISKWADEVTKASDGTIEVKGFPGSVLGSLQVIYDRVVNGVVEVAFCTVGPIVTQFPKTTIAALPFETTNGREGSLALWGLYERGLLADEFARVRPVAIGAFANVSIHSRKPIKTLEDVRGMKISVQSRLTGQVMEKLGGVAVSMPVTDFYSALSRGTVDAAGTGWPAVHTFKVIEIVTTHVEEPLGGEVNFNAMNKDAYARLPDKARQAVDRYSGKVFSEWMGRAIDADENAGREAGRAMKDHVLVKLPPAEEARWKERARPVVEEWAKATPDGDKVLAAFREEIAKVRAGK